MLAFSCLCPPEDHAPKTWDILLAKATRTAVISRNSAKNGQFLQNLSPANLQNHRLSDTACVSLQDLSYQVWNLRPMAANSIPGNSKERSLHLQCVTVSYPALFQASIPPITFNKEVKPWRCKIEQASELRWPLPHMTASGRLRSRSMWRCSIE